MLDSTALKEKIGEPLLTAVPDRRASAPERRHSVPDKAAEQRAEEQQKQQQLLQQQQLQELERVKSQLQRCDLFNSIRLLCLLSFFFSRLTRKSTSTFFCFGNNNLIARQ
jgi:hypothetical protein